MGLKCKEISFSKFLIFYLVVIIVLVYTVIPKIWYSITYQKNRGEMQYFEPKPVITIIGEYIKMSPGISFALKNKTYSFFGSSYLHESFYAGDSVKIIYDPHSPQRAYVNSWIGNWGPLIVNAIPFF